MNGVPAKVEDVVADMDKLIDTYKLLNKKVERLVLSKPQWDTLSNWCRKLAEDGGAPNNGISYDQLKKCPVYRGFRLERG